MIKSLLRQFSQDFAYDPDAFSDMGEFSEYTYRELMWMPAGSGKDSKTGWKGTLRRDSFFLTL